MNGAILSIEYLQGSNLLFNEIKQIKYGEKKAYMK